MDLGKLAQVLGGAATAGGAVAAATGGVLDQNKDEPWVGRLRDFLHPPPDPPMGSIASQEVARRFAPQGGEISQGDAFWMGGGRPLPQRSAADAYRMGGLAAMDQYKPNTFRDIDRQDIEDRYGGADLHGIKLPPVSKGEPRAWFDAVVPQSPLDVGLMAAGPAGRIAGKGAAALTGAAGVMGELVDPAEAAPFKKLLSSTSAFTPDKPGDLSWWHRIANRKLDRPLGDIPFEAVGNIPQVGRRVTPADLEGNFMMPLPGDPTHRGKTFTSIDDIRLSTPYTSQGGMPYIAATEGFANAPSAASTAANRVKRFEEKYDVPVIGSYLKMGPQSADFSSHTWAPLARMFPEAPMTQAGVKELNTDIRSRIAELPEGARGEKFPGVKAGNLDAFLERQPDVYRKAVIGATEQARGNIAGVPDVVAVRYAMTHPDLLNAPASSSGLAMTRLTGETRPGTHTDYKTHLVGEGSFGLGMQLPREVAFPDWAQKIDKIPSYKNRPDRWLQAMYQKPPPKIPYGQELTPQWVDRTSQYMEDVPKMGETAALNKYVLQHFGWK